MLHLEISISLPRNYLPSQIILENLFAFSIYFARVFPLFGAQSYGRSLKLCPASRRGYALFSGRLARRRGKEQS